MTEEILTYNTPNSEEILKKINQYDFKRIWKKNLDKNYKNLFYGIIFLVLAAFMFFSKISFGYFFLGGCIMYFVFFFNYLFVFKKIKKNFNDLLTKDIAELNQNSKDAIWEFTPTHFSFKNYKSEYKFIWQEITYCILEDKYLYITVSSFMNFILDKANIDEVNLNKTH